jgi:hypothetical protein
MKTALEKLVAQAAEFGEQHGRKTGTESNGHREGSWDRRHVLRAGPYRLEITDTGTWYDFSDCSYSPNSGGGGQRYTVWLSKNDKPLLSAKRTPKAGCDCYRWDVSELEEAWQPKTPGGPAPQRPDTKEALEDFLAQAAAKYSGR